MPILARFDPTKRVFMKTDWIAEGMAWIFMHPADGEQSDKIEKKLIATG